MVRRKLKRLSQICPENKAPTECSCKSQEEPITPPFDNVLNILSCMPDKCTCEGGSEVSVQAEKKNPIDKLSKVCGNPFT